MPIAPFSPSLLSRQMGKETEARVGVGNLQPLWGCQAGEEPGSGLGLAVMGLPRSTVYMEPPRSPGLMYDRAEYFKQAFSLTEEEIHRNQP